MAKVTPEIGVGTDSGAEVAVSEFPGPGIEAGGVPVGFRMSGGKQPKGGQWTVLGPTDRMGSSKLNWSMNHRPKYYPES